MSEGRIGAEGEKPDAVVLAQIDVVAIQRRNRRADACELPFEFPQSRIRVERRQRLARDARDVGGRDERIARARRRSCSPK